MLRKDWGAKAAPQSLKTKSMASKVNIFIILSLLIIYPACLAQGPISLNVWPPKIELSAVPGETKTGVINVDNKGSAVANIVAYITDIGMDQNGDLSFPEGGTLSFSCEPWLLINPEQFTLSQGSSQQVRYTLKVPQDASGTYLAHIFFQTRPDFRMQSTGSAISARLGTLIILNVTGTGSRAAEIFTLGTRQGREGKQAQLEIGIRNKGNIMLRPTGTVEIKSEAGFTVEKVEFNQDKQAVLPYSERRYPVAISSNLDPGSYRLIATVDYGGRELLAGEARINLVPAQPAAARTEDVPIKAKAKSEPAARTRQETQAVQAPKASAEEIQSLMSQGTKLYASGDYEKALAIWQRILRLDPGNAAASRNLSRTREKLEAIKRAKGG